MRISDLLDITAEQIRGVDPDARQLNIVESKTGKSRAVILNQTALAIANRRLADNQIHVYLFQSTSPRKKKDPAPMTRRQVARVFSEVGQQVTPMVQLSTHSRRKTRGYVMHSSGVAIERISEILNRSSTAITMTYIGLDAESISSSYDEFELKIWPYESNREYS